MADAAQPNVKQFCSLFQSKNLVVKIYKPANDTTNTHENIIMYIIIAIQAMQYVENM